QPPAASRQPPAASRQPPAASRQPPAASGLNRKAAKNAKGKAISYQLSASSGRSSSRRRRKTSATAAIMDATPLHWRLKAGG
ncbi:hypothetical protein, partial [Marichromatium gracile]|uniref:hypothetical protein n=1 Tax=Marichromatium gracile TaxID=1048 RepID=UPI001F471E86